MSVIRQRIVSKKDIKKSTPDDQNDNVAVEDPPIQESLKSKICGYIKLTLQLLGLLAITPALINFAALIREEKELKPVGDMIDVRNGQKLFRTCEGKGSPTVILDAPTGRTSDVWSAILPAIAKVTKVCTYDRAGLGYSDRVYMGINDTAKTGKPYTVERMFEDFHKLFEDVEKPFVLVGADLGAVVVKFYAQMLKDSVASLILVNPIFDGLFMGKDNPWNKLWFYSHLPSLQLKHMTSAAGLNRIGLQTGFLSEPFKYKNVPDKSMLRQKYLLCSPGHMSSVVEENYFLNVTMSQMRTLNKLRPLHADVPLHLVLTDRFTDDITEKHNKIWLKSQEISVKTFANDIAQITRLKGSVPEILFTKCKTFEKHIIRAVKNWRKSTTTTSTTTSKY